MSSLSQNAEMIAQRKQDWEEYQKSNLKYDDAKPYFNYVIEQEIALDRKEQKPNGAPWVQAYLCETLRHAYEVSLKDDAFVKKKYYDWYVANERTEWRKKWKPNDVQDQGLNFMFITLNYKQGTPVDKVLLDTSRIINLPVLSNSKITYTYENYTDTGSHPHVHCLIELNRTGTVSMSKLLEKIYQDKKLKDYLAVDVKFSWAKDFTKRCQKRSVCLAYLSGNKIDNKLENSDLDKIWRIENNLDDIYYKVNN